MQRKQRTYNESPTGSCGSPKYRYGRVDNCSGLIFRGLRASLVRIQLSVLKTYAEMKAGGDAWGGSYPPTERCDGFDSRLCFQLKPTMR